MDSTLIKVFAIVVGIITPLSLFIGYRVLSYYDNSIKELKEEDKDQWAEITEMGKKLAKMEGKLNGK